MEESVGASANKVIDIYVINLKHRADKWKEIKKSFEKYPSINLIRTDASSPSQVGDPGWRHCALSHLNLIKFAQKENLEYIIVAEDDTVPTKYFDIRLNMLLQFLKDRKEQSDTSEDSCVIFNGNPSIPPILRKRGPRHFGKFKDGEPVMVDSLPVILESFQYYTTNFMIYSRESYQPIIELLKTYPETVDLGKQSHMAIDVQLGKNFKQLTMLPYLTYQSSAKSDIDVDGIDNTEEVIKPSEKWLLEKYVTNRAVYLRNIQGGLGNILFQVASSYGIARMKEGALLVNTKNISPHEGNDNSLYKEKIFKPFVIQTELLQEYLPTRIVNRNVFNLTENEPFRFRNPVRKLPLGINGYLQNKNYFHPYRSRLLKLFGFEQSKCVSSTRTSSNNSSVSVHIRRGDYIKLSHIHRNISMTYYKKHLDELMLANTSSDIKVYSDDLDWCIEWVSTEFKDTKSRFKFIELPPLETLVDMSQSDTFILSNSTFGWWGAYLCPEIETAKIIQPSQWFYEDITDGLVLPRAELSDSN